MEPNQLKKTEKNKTCPLPVFMSLFVCIPGLRNAKRVPRMNLSILHMLLFWCGMRISNLLIYFNARHFCALYGFTVYTKEPTAAGHQSHNSSSTAAQTTAVGVSVLHCLKGWGGGEEVGKGVFNISGFPSSSSLVLSAKVPTGRNIGCIRRTGKSFFGYQIILGSKLCRTFPETA
jgi:hypothetical protein